MGQNKPSLFRIFRLTMLVIVSVILVLLFEPHLFRAAVKLGVQLQAARHGVSLEVGSVDGNIFKPLVFRDMRFSTSLAGVVSKATIHAAKVSFYWHVPYIQKGHGFFERLTLDGINADVNFQPNARSSGPSPTPTEKEFEFQPWFPVPAYTEVINSNLVFHLDRRMVTFADVRFTISSLKPGIIAIEKLTFEHGRTSRSFSVLRGTTALQGARWRIADLNLSDGVLLKNLSSDFDEMSKGELQVDFDFEAFGGSLRGELINTATTRPPTYEITGNFSRISVEALGKFLRVQEKTGGVIREGKFNFRGTPSDLENATISTRFEATDFLWGKRQWNSLVLGAIVVNRRVQIPELELQQAHNVLRAKGELSLPNEETPWWLSDFAFDVAAQINNLGELSALFGPEFADASGKMTVDGSVRSDNKSYSGQLIVAGTKLSWKGVPLDQVNAGIKLDGNELQVLNLDIAHGTDFVRGKGMISVLGERRYQGELNASIEELSVYGPLLQKPIVPAPPVGGLIVNWSGDGTMNAHSGAFTAHFRKLHTLATKELPATLPIDADLEGTYAPGVFSLSKCILANEDTRLEGRLAADETTVKLEVLKLTQKKVPWLEGDAILPFNLFQWWVQPGPAALAPDAPFKAQITAKDVQLEEVAHLTGRAIPIRGILNGTLKTESTLRNLRMIGSVKLTKGQLPSSEWVPALDKLEAEADIDSNILRITKLSAHHALGDFSATGSLDFSQFDMPAFDLLIHGEKVRFNAGPMWDGSANLDLAINGTRDAANVNGTASVVAVESTPRPNFGALITTGNPETIRVPAPAILLKAPFDHWNYRVTVSTQDALKIKEGTIAANMRFTGTGSPLAATGNITFTGLPASNTFAIGKLESGTWYLDKAGETLVAHIQGKFLAANAPVDFEGYYLGALDQLNPVFWSNSSNNADENELIQTAFTPGLKSLPADTASLPLDPGVLGSYNPKLADEIATKQEAQAAASPTPENSPTPTPNSTPQ